MKYSPSSRDALDAHCREVIRSCLNIVEQHGDTYVAIHKDDEIDCVVLVSMIRSYQIINRADVGGQYLNEWQTAKTTWVTTVRRFNTTPLPKTGY